MLSGKVAKLGFRYGTNGYTVHTAMIDGTEYRILAGGRPRGAITLLW